MLLSYGCVCFYWVYSECAFSLSCKLVKMQIESKAKHWSDDMGKKPWKNRSLLLVVYMCVGVNKENKLGTGKQLGGRWDYLCYLMSSSSTFFWNWYVDTLINNSGSAFKQKTNSEFLCEHLKIIFFQSSDNTTTQKKSHILSLLFYAFFWENTGKHYFCVELEGLIKSSTALGWSDHIF